MKKTTDEILWQRYREADQSAFTELSRRYYRKLLHYGLKFTPNIQLVEDAIQELYIHLWLYRNTINQTEYVKYYLMKAFRHQLFKMFRKLKTTVEISEVSEFAFFEHSSEESFIELESDQIANHQVQQLISTLSPRQQEVIYLRFFHNLGVEEIATQLSINPQSVSNIIQRAFHKVRELWPNNPVANYAS
jgi:RNA polymerase sigma factor (sigma-70 family)